MTKKNKVILYSLVTLTTLILFLIPAAYYKSEVFKRHFTIFFSDVLPLASLFVAMFFGVILLLLTDQHWKNKNPDIKEIISYTNNSRVMYLELVVVGCAFGLMFFPLKVITLLITLFFTLWMPIFKWHRDGSLFYSSSNYKQNRPPFKKRILNRHNKRHK